MLKTRLLLQSTWVTLVIILLLTGCQKDGQGMQLIAEGFGETKAAVEGNYCYWVDGETVRINGVNKTINYDGDRAFVSNVTEAAVYRALYPDTLNSTATLTGDAVSVLIPHTYTYREENGRQRLGVPMVARGTSDNRLWFQHLTAAITVEITNHYGFTIEVDSVAVMSNAYQLSGQKDITLAESMTVEANNSGVSDADKRVAVYFNGGTSLQILAGETRRVQVPVLPVGDDNRFTIKVGVHKVDDANVKYLFDKTQAGGQANYALARRQMGYAGVTLGGVFTVAYGKQVIISQGNLQYVPRTNTWSFHTHQYDICEPGAVDSSMRYIAGGTLPIDLFGYGTSGHNNMHPYMTSKTDTDYIAPISTLVQTDYDWGWHNAISNGGNAAGEWYSLNSTQWRHLFNTRIPTTSGINSNNPTRYTYATIDGTHTGVILFPDNYSHPTNADTLIGVFNNYSNYATIVSLDNWQKLEAAGAVFLPAAGYRIDAETNSTGCHKITQVSSQGLYWTGGTTTRTEANRLVFEYTSVPRFYKDYGFRHFGMSVRVVKDI
jgi:hypothetical protein